MTELQQAYDRAMAHNAMLREALKVTTAVLEKRSDGYDAVDVALGEQALNATKADAKTWLVDKELEQYELGYEAGKAITEQQLATVTNERDALRNAVALVNPVASLLYHSRVPDKEYETNKGAIFMALTSLYRAMQQSPPSE